MCGIFAIVNDHSQKAAQTVMTGLKKLEYRGYDSWGIAVKPLKQNQIKLEKHTGKIGAAETILPAGEIALGHTRWATHGGVTDENAHPHLDGSGKICVVHNGIVENYQKLRADLKKKSHRFKSETDTEVIAHLIEEKRKKMPIVKAVFAAFKTIVGSNAIAVFDAESQQIIACRDGSPLVLGLGEQEFYLASDVTAFLKHTNKVIFLEDGEGALLSTTGVKLYDLATGQEKKRQAKVLDWDDEAAEKGNYPHFLLKEIMEQQTTIPKTANLNQAEIEKLAKKISKTKKVFLIACGTAYHCCLLASYYFAKEGVVALPYHAHEFHNFFDYVAKDDLVIAVSQSGETADTLIACKAAKKQGAKVAAIINARGSTLERLADDVLSVGAGPEIAVVSTKASTSQISTLYLLAKASNGQYAAAKRQIKKLGSDLNSWLDKKLTSQILTLAKELLDKDHLYLIGKNANYPGVLEFALKVKETSYLHAEAFAASELKHGVISLIMQDTPCVVLADQDEFKDEVLSSATELKARGGKIFGIAPFNAPEFDFHLQTPDWGDLTVMAHIIVGQLLGYFLGIGRGADPDKPRNLAKSVTVK